VRSLVRQREKRGVALAPHHRQIGEQLLLRIGLFGRHGGVALSPEKGSGGSKVFLTGTREIQVEPEERMIRDIGITRLNGVKTYSKVVK